MAGTAKDLVKKIASDASFRQSLESAGTKEARRAILQKNGFGNVTADQVKALGGGKQSSELSDAQLQSVAGGRMVEWAGVVVAAAALAL